MQKIKILWMLSAALFTLGVSAGAAEIAVHIAVVDEDSGPNSGNRTTPASVDRVIEQLVQIYGPANVRTLVIPKKPGVALEKDLISAFHLASLDIKKEDVVKALVIQGRSYLRTTVNARGESINRLEMDPFGSLNFADPTGRAASYFKSLEKRLAKDATISFIEGQTLRAPGDFEKVKEIQAFFGATEGAFYGEDRYQQGQMVRYSNGTARVEDVYFNGVHDGKILGGTLQPVALHIAYVDGKTVTYADVIRLHKKFKAANRDRHVRLIEFHPGKEGSDANWYDLMTNKLNKMGAIDALMIQNSEIRFPTRASGRHSDELELLHLRLSPKATVAFVGRSSSAESPVFIRENQVFLGASEGHFFLMTDFEHEEGVQIRISNEPYKSRILRVGEHDREIFSCEGAFGY